MNCHSTQMTRITKIVAREIFDSRGNPTIETRVELNCGVVGVASVPSGASTGVHEAIELRDGTKHRFHGLGVLKAVKNVNTQIAKAIVGMDSASQAEIDLKMIDLDSTPNKSRLGANAILSVSLAAARAASNAQNLELFRYLGGFDARLLPMPMMNIINAGAHSDAPIDVQEFMIVPLGAKNFTHAVRMGVEVFQNLKSVLKSKGLSTAVGDEGGFAPQLKSCDEAIETIALAVKNAGYKFGKDIVISLDVAASEFYCPKTGKYTFKKSDSSTRDSDGMIEFIADLKERYPIWSVEDACAESDWKGWEKLTKTLGDCVQLVGDDLFVTNTKFLKKGIAKKAANAILIKVNQIGTLTETFEAIRTAQRAGFGVIVSHRSGETEDTFIADIAVASNAGQIKTGSLSRSDRIAKYNRLMFIESHLGDSALFKKY